MRTRWRRWGDGGCVGLNRFGDGGGGGDERWVREGIREVVEEEDGCDRNDRKGDDFNQSRCLHCV